MNSGKVLLGIAFTAIGVVLLLGTADVVDPGEVLAAWWPTIIVAAGLLAMFGRPPAWVGGGIVTLVGLAALGVTTGLLDVGFGAIAGVALIALGLWFAFGRRGASEAGADTVDVVCVFSGRDLASSADPFRGGSITGVFGGVELDLTNARLEDGAVLDATGIFGGHEITVPPGWRIQMNGPAIFGGFEDHTGRQVLAADAPTLTIRALALFGGIEVKLGTPTNPQPVDLTGSNTML